MNLEPAASAFMGGSALLAHQGGWDEILLVVVPLVAVGLLLYVANRQVSAKLTAEQRGTVPEPPDQAPPSGDSPPQQNRDRNQA